MWDGNWNSNYTAVKNEKQFLKISLSGESVFERHFENSSSQKLNSSEFEFLDDLLVFTFTSPDIVFGYKLVLSGWKSRSKNGKAVVHEFTPVDVRNIRAHINALENEQKRHMEVKSFTV